MSSKSVEKPILPPRQNQIKSENEKAATSKPVMAYWRQIIANPLQELGLPNDVNVEVRLADSKTSETVHALRLSNSDVELDLALEGDLPWKAAKQGGRVNLQPDSKSESVLLISIEWPKPAAVTLIISRANGERFHLLASAPALHVHACQVKKATLSATVGEIVVQPNSTLSSGHLVIDRGHFVLKRNSKVFFHSSKTATFAVAGAFTAYGSIVSSSGNLKLIMTDSVMTYAESEWLTSSAVFGRIKGRLTVSGGIQWDEIGLASSNKVLKVGECLFEDTACVQIKRGGTMAISGLFYNRTSKFSWEGLLSISAGRFSQMPSAGFVSPKGRLQFKARSVEDEMLMGQFEVAQLSLEINGQLKCNAQIQAGKFTVLLINQNSGITFLTPLNIDGPIIGESSDDQADLSGYMSFSKSMAKLMGCIHAPQLVLRLEKGSEIHLRAHTSKSADLFHIFAYELHTEPDSVIHLIKSENTSSAESIMQLQIANSWQHKGSITSEALIGEFRVVAEISMSFWSACKIEFSRYSSFNCQGSFVLESGATIEGKLQLEISSYKIELKPKSRIACCTRDENENKLVAKTGSTLINSGSIEANNITLTASENLENTRSGMILAHNSMVIRSIPSVINEGTIKTLNGPLRLIAGKLDNFYGHLVSENNSIYIDLHDQGSTKISGRISTKQALVIQASQSSSLKINARLIPEALPNFLFVLGSLTGETIVTNPIQLGNQSVARFVSGHSLKFCKEISVTKLEIDVTRGDDTSSKPVSVHFDGLATISQLKISAETPSTVFLMCPGILKVEELVLGNLSSLEISNNLEANRIVVRDVAKIQLIKGAQLSCQQLLNEPSLLRIDEGAFASFNSSLKIKPGRFECYGTVAMTNGNILCKELFCGEKSRMILGTASSEEADERNETGEEDKLKTEKTKRGKNPAHIINALLGALPQILPKIGKAALMIAQLILKFKIFFTIAVKMKGMVEKITKEGITSMPIQLSEIIGIVLDCISASTVSKAGIKQIRSAAELPKDHLSSSLSVDKFEVADLQRATATLIANYCLPSMSENSVLSLTNGVRSAYGFKDRGVEGKNGEVTIVGGNYMADFFGSYSSRRMLLACGDIIVSSKYLEVSDKTVARGDVRLQAESLVTSKIMAYSDFRALIGNKPSVSNVTASNTSVEQTVMVEERSIVATAEKCTNDILPFTKRNVVRRKHAMKRSAVLLHKVDSIQPSAQLNVKSKTHSSMPHVPVECTALRNLADQVFGITELDAIFYRSQEISRLKILESLNVEIPRQEVIFDRLLSANAQTDNSNLGGMIQGIKDDIDAGKKESRRFGVIVEDDEKNIVVWKSDSPQNDAETSGMKDATRRTATNSESLSAILQAYDAVSGEETWEFYFDVPLAELFSNHERRLQKINATTYISYSSTSSFSEINIAVCAKLADKCQQFLANLPDSAKLCS